MKRSGKVFIDANIIIHAESFQKADVFGWLHGLYEEVYIHKTVLDELRISSVRMKVETFIAEKKWILFDPADENTVSDETYELYQSFVRDMQDAFHQLNEKKAEEKRYLKHTNDLGEIHSMAAAMLLSANIICSNDLGIREVIDDFQIFITVNEDEGSVLLEQDTLEDFCYYVIVYDIDKRSLARKFFKSIQPDRIQVLDDRLSKL